MKTALDTKIEFYDNEAAKYEEIFDLLVKLKNLRKDYPDDPMLKRMEESVDSGWVDTSWGKSDWYVSETKTRKSDIRDCNYCIYFKDCNKRVENPEILCCSQFQGEY